MNRFDFPRGQFNVKLKTTHNDPRLPSKKVTSNGDTVAERAKLEIERKKKKIYLIYFWEI